MRVPLALFFFFSYVCVYLVMCVFIIEVERRTFFFFLVLPGFFRACSHIVDTRNPKGTLYKTRGEKKKKKTLLLLDSPRGYVHQPLLSLSTFSLFLPETRRRRTKKEKREKINRFIVSKHKIRHRNEKIRKCRIGKNTKTLNSPFNSSLPSCVCV